MGDEQKRGFAQTAILTMAADLEARLRAVEDELAIRTLAARFSDCANERDFEGFADLWSARGVWEIGPPSPACAEGVDAITEMLRRRLSAHSMFIHMTHSGVIQLQGDTARARFVERELGRCRRGYYENLAVHEDELRREADGKWRFSRRVYHYRYLDDSAFGGQVLPLINGAER